MVQNNVFYYNYIDIGFSISVLNSADNLQTIPVLQHILLE